MTPGPQPVEGTAPVAATRREPTVVVAMGEAAVGGPDDVLAIYGLGSCVALAVWRSRTRRGALCHIVLPEGILAPGDPPARYATTAVEWARNALGPAPDHEFTVKLAGGASMLPIPGHLSLLEIGRRNLDAVRGALARWDLRAVATDTGGTVGRTVFFHPADGRLAVRTAAGEERLL